MSASVSLDFKAVHKLHYYYYYYYYIKNLATLTIYFTSSLCSSPHKPHHQLTISICPTTVVQD